MLSPRPMVARSTGEARPLSTVSITANAIPATCPMRMGRAWATMPRTMDRSSISRAPSLRLGLTRFAPESRGPRRLAGLDQAWILALEDRHDVRHGHVRIYAALAHVLHVAPAGPVVGLEDRVLAAVELQRENAEALAEGQVEGRRGLHPP